MNWSHAWTEVFFSWINIANKQIINFPHLFSITLLTRSYLLFKTRFWKRNNNLTDLIGLDPNTRLDPNIEYHNFYQVEYFGQMYAPEDRSLKNYHLNQLLSYQKCDWYYFAWSLVNIITSSGISITFCMITFPYKSKYFGNDPVLVICNPSWGTRQSSLARK